MTLASDKQDKDLKRLVESACQASGCQIGVFFSGCRPELVWEASAGPDNLVGSILTDTLSARIEALSCDEVLVEEVGPDQDAQARQNGVRFLAATKVLGKTGIVIGALVVADTRFHAGLTAAQTYVFQTHSAQLAANIAYRNLQSRLDLDIQEAISARTERLRLLESVVVNAKDAVIITEAEPIDLPGPRIVYCNRAFEVTSGYSEAEVLGKTPRILQAAGTDRAALGRLKDALTRWRPVEVELLNKRKDGTEFWVELSIVPVANEKGWFTHWVSVQRDVSDRKRAEETAARARVAEAENRAFAAEIIERKRVESHLLHEAFHDRLTKLHNRAYFMDFLERTLRDLKGADRPHTVLFLDLDGFKLVNDSLGHRAGDVLLITIAHRLASVLRPQDVLARIGGDEFAVLLENTSIKAGIEVATGIIAALKKPLSISDRVIFSSCSVGIAQSSDSLSADELLRNADIAMYRAKKRGLGGYAVYADSMHEDAIAVLSLQTDLRGAVARDEFRLFFQPICDPATSGITGLEALIRWQHPERGLLSPTSFIAMAEEIGIIRDIGRWVLRTACVQLSTWQKLLGPSGLRMSVNVSSDELLDTGYVSELELILEETGILPSALQLEITESVFLRQPSVIGGILETIRQLGVRIALDDFGTGFSSLSYIDQYPVDTIKIDRSFVERMLVHRRTLAIIETIIRLGKSLDLQIVAEGVETEEELTTLKALGCAHAQGYLFAKPLPVIQMTSLLETRFTCLPGAVALQRQLGFAFR